MHDVNLCLFAHFDKDDKVDEHVLRYLEKIRESGFEIVFISTSRLSAACVARLRSECRDVILRENKGFDFASWSAGFAKHRDAIGGRLLLANDSVYGPIGSLRTALDRLTSVPTDFYGMVESIEAKPHLQSWFVLLEPWVVRDEAFKAVMTQPFGEMAKAQIIARGEVALSQQLVAAGFRYNALCKRDSFGTLPPRHAMNPMLLFWHEVLFEQGVPFLKIELLRDNPLEVEGAGAILREVAHTEPRFGSIIKSHLTRTRNTVAVLRRPLLLSRLRCTLIRKRFRRARQKRLMGAALLTVLLALVTTPIIMGRAVKALFGLR